MKRVANKDYGSPNMSDTTILMSVEDLINIAMGPPNKNRVNFKLVQTILHILARQMRLLEQRVEIRVEDELEHSPRLADVKERRGRSRERIKSKDQSREQMHGRRSKDRDKEEKAHKERDRTTSKDRGKADKADAKERADKAHGKEKDKAEKEGQKGDREKDKDHGSKEKEKGEKTAAKDKDKAERGESKERDKAEKAGGKDERGKSKEREKAEKAAEKEDRASSKDRDKAGKEKEASQSKSSGKAEKEEKLSPRAKEKMEKKVAEGDKKGKGKGKTASETSIVVSEAQRKKEKVLVVEKGPTTRTDKSREGIEVVTRSQFELVESLVKDLAKHAGPLPAPAMPDNEKLRSDLVKGQASLTDTMQAMQVTARVRAAEEAIGRMGELLTQLAAAGALPADLAGQIEGAKLDLGAADEGADGTQLSKTKSTVSRKSVAIDPTMASQASMGRPSAVSRASVARRASVASRGSSASGMNLPAVTHPELDEAIRDLKSELTKNVTLMTAKATAIAENANTSAKAVSDKLEIALKLDRRISTLFSLTSDYAEQLTGFDAGLTTQMQSFRDQMSQMRSELTAGLTQLEQVNNNAETAAVMELTERYEGLVTELDHAMHAHRGLTACQKQLSDELHSLVECVEMLREQKADRDEVLDGLRDKADNSRLAGLLTSKEFASARVELEKRLEVCHDKFRRQETVWMTALKDLTNVTEQKAEVTQLLAAREAAECMLRELQDMQMHLALILGEPKAAILTRALAVGASCGACLAPALMEPQDASYGAPPPLPALRLRTAPAEPCEPAWKPPDPPDHRDHTCHRWVGGSHTLLSEAVTRERAPPIQLLTPPTKKYVGYGDDQRLYMLEEELQPCVECNKFSSEAAPTGEGAGAGGDQAVPPASTT